MVNTTKLRNLAKNKGIKISFLCEQFGLHRSYINNIERGKATMSDDRIQKIADVLGTTYEYLMDLSDNPESNSDDTKNEEIQALKREIEQKDAEIKRLNKLLDLTLQVQDDLERKMKYLKDSGVDTSIPLE